MTPVCMHASGAAPCAHTHQSAVGPELIAAESVTLVEFHVASDGADVKAQIVGLQAVLHRQREHLHQQHQQRRQTRENRCPFV